MYNINNHARFIGTLQGEPVIEKEQDGSSVATFTLACRDNFLRHDGEPSVQFLPMTVALPDDDATARVKALKAGDFIQIAAQVRGQSWTDSEGYRHQDLKLVGYEFGPAVEQ